MVGKKAQKHRFYGAFAKTSKTKSLFALKKTSATVGTKQLNSFAAHKRLHLIRCAAY